MRDVGLTGEIT